MSKSQPEHTWEKGKKHGLRAVHRVRRNAKGKIVEERYAERAFYGALVAWPLVAGALWYVQADLEAPWRVVAIVVAILVSLYASYLVVITWLLGHAGRLLSRLVDSL